MKDEEVVARLQELPPGTTAVDVARTLDRLVDGGVQQGMIVTFFKRAFPSIPLRTLLEAAGWRGVGGGLLSDEEFNELLRPWLPA